MFPIHWPWDWGWGWAAAVGGIFALGVFILPWFLFLLNLHTLLERVRDENRSMPAGQVWLNFIPVFFLGWFIYTVMKVRDSVQAEYRTRGWVVEGDLGYNVGVAAGVLAIASFILGWALPISWMLTIGWLVCWILYWIKTSDLKNRLGEAPTWHGTAGPPSYPPPTPPPAPGAYPPPAPGVYPPPSGHAPPASPPQSEQARLCAACGSAYDPGDQFCRVCGLPLPKSPE